MLGKTVARLELDSWVQSSKRFSLAAAVSDKLLGEGFNEAAFIFLTERPPKRLFVVELALLLRKTGLRSRPRLGDFAKAQIFLTVLPELRPLTRQEPWGYRSRGQTEVLSRGQT